jgi:ATP-dependent RNA helicase RhlE
LRVEVTPQATTVERIGQQVIHVDQKQKPVLLAHLLGDRSMTRAIVFTRTKHGANRVAERLSRDGIAAEAIHGNKSQTARERSLEGFRTGNLRVLVATDLAARGIDVSGISHVINYDLPNEPESYVHRIGRTARAGASGSAIAFCSPEERPFLKDIERLTRQAIPVGQLPDLPKAVDEASDRRADAEFDRAFGNAKPGQSRQNRQPSRNAPRRGPGGKAEPARSTERKAPQPVANTAAPVRPKQQAGEQDQGIGALGFMRPARSRSGQSS